MKKDEKVICAIVMISALLNVLTVNSDCTRAGMDGSWRPLPVTPEGCLPYIPTTTTYTCCALVQTECSGSNESQGIGNGSKCNSRGPPSKARQAVQSQSFPSEIFSVKTPTQGEGPHASSSLLKLPTSNMTWGQPAL